MINLEKIFQCLKIKFDYIISKKITFCQRICLKKVFNLLKMNTYKSVFIPIDPENANYLLFYNGNVDKKN